MGSEGIWINVGFIALLMACLIGTYIADKRKLK